MVLLSVMNFVQNSYVLITTYVDNPNATVTSGIWFQRWPSYLTSGVRPTCEPANLPVNTQFFTNQSGLTWTLTSIFNNDDGSSALPSMPYLSNHFQACVIREIRMEYDSTPEQDVIVQQNSAWDIELRSFVTCSILGPSGYTHFNATASFNSLMPYAVPGQSSFVARDATGRSSMYWSEALLSSYWVLAVKEIWTVSAQMWQKYNIKFGKGVVTLYQSTDQTDITELDFFDMQFDFLQKEPQGYGYTGILNSLEFYLKANNNTSIPHIWSSVDKLAKAMYSATLADLGQLHMPPQSSLVVDPTVLQNFTADFNDTMQYTIPLGAPF